jgi:hypothetical protein
MAVRILASAVLSAIVMFFWGFVYWGPVLNVAHRITAPLPADAELDVLAPLRRANTPTGMYVYPAPVDMGDDAAVKAHGEKMTEGPIIHMAYASGGAAPMDPVMFAKGFGLDFVVALFGALVLAMAVPALPSYGRRVLALALVTFLAAVWSHGDNVIWWFHTPRYALGQMAYMAGGGVLMSLVTAAIVKPMPRAIERT